MQRELSMRVPSLRLLHQRPLLIVSAVILLGAPGAWLLAGNPARDDAAVVARVKRGAFKVTVTTSGELRARQFVQITVPTGGQQAGVFQMKISSIVPEGPGGKQGDGVAELDRTPVAAKVQEVGL